MSDAPSMPAARNQSAWLGDSFGGLAATLVALPSAIAFGLVTFGPLGQAYAAQAVIFGLLGSVALGLITPLFGGTPRLVTAPCAPAAAVLVVFVVELSRRPHFSPDIVPVLLSIVTVAAGVTQFLLGAAGGGRFIKYIPYPVVAGYLSGVGVLIFVGQLAKFLGAPSGTAAPKAIMHPELWQWPALVVGGVTILVMLFSKRITDKIPAAVLALVAGIGSYFLLGAFKPELLTLQGNPFLLGPLGGGPAELFNQVVGHWKAAGALGWHDIAMITVPALTLAVLLSVDTLKTCVVLDAMTGSRTNSNRELLGQGLGNCAAGLVGGMAGAGTMGATLVNVVSGGQTKRSGFLVGILSLAAVLFLGGLLAWVPLSALAGILLVVGVRMVDWKGFKLLRRRSTALDFVVVLAVIASAVSFSLLAAAGVGVAMAIVLFLRDQARSPVVQRKAFGDESFSKRRRLPSEQKALAEHGKSTLILELRGNLFFGTTDRLFTEVEPHLAGTTRLVLDLRRITSIDFTGANLLGQLAKRLKERGGTLALASLPSVTSSGRGARAYLEEVGLLAGHANIRVFDDIDDALEWSEEEILAAALPEREAPDQPLPLHRFELFAGIEASELAALIPFLVERHVAPGEAVFRRGEAGESMFFIRRGTVKIVLPLEGGLVHHLATFSRGDFFGDMAFLDREIRSADALADGETMLWELARPAFDRCAAEHPVLSARVYERLAHALAFRLRLNNIQLQALQQG